MKTNTRTVAAVWIGLLATAPVIFSQSQPNDALELRTVVTQLAAEVRSLKTEILRLQVEASEARVHKSQLEWDSARQEQERLDQEHRELTQEAQELSAELLQPSLSPETRAELVEAKFKAETSKTAKLLAERASADRQEALARDAYEQTRKAHSQLLDRAVILSHKTQ